VISYPVSHAKVGLALEHLRALMREVNHRDDHVSEEDPETLASARLLSFQ
jgi:hypothetical protein